jgi:protein-L-isoaspartate(D-aspartate) O-methyltransferase
MDKDEIRIALKLMVEGQISARGILNPNLLTVMKSVPRHRFVPSNEQFWAYTDGPLPISHGQTISQPYIVALMTELLELNSSDRVLEVGTGSGYQAAVLGELTQEVHTIEVIPELAAQAAIILVELGYLNVNVHSGDGSLGWPDAAPYDGILVSAAAPYAPVPLLNQLADGARLVLPVGSRGFQNIEVWKRNGNDFEHRVDLAVTFVPLRGEHGWK